MLGTTNEKDYSLTLLVEGPCQAVDHTESVSGGVLLNNIPTQDYNLYQSLNFDSGDSLTNSPSKCNGKGCELSGKTLLKINYINKTGYFCEIVQRIS